MNHQPYKILGAVKWKSILSTNISLHFFQLRNILERERKHDKHNKIVLIGHFNSDL
jgi:hypothetical protein